MATDRYVPTAVGTTTGSYRLPPADGAPVKTVMVSFEKTAADNDTSVIRVAKGFKNQQIVGIRIENDALTGATDIDVGLYKGEGGEVVDADCFADELDINAGNAIMDGVIAMKDLDLADRNKTVAEIAGAVNNATPPEGGYDIAITGNTFGTAVGTINVIIEYV
jgi:hypothetical protein